MKSHIITFIFGIIAGMYLGWLIKFLAIVALLFLIWSLLVFYYHKIMDGMTYEEMIEDDPSSKHVLFIPNKIHEMIINKIWPAIKEVYKTKA